MFIQLRIINFIIFLFLYTASVFPSPQTVEKFDYQINCSISAYDFDKNKNTLYFINKNLVLHIIDLDKDTVKKTQLDISNQLKTNIPYNWSRNSNLILLDSLEAEQSLNSIKEKISQLQILGNSEEIILLDNGGGLVFNVDLNTKTISRIDDSFPTMNKFGGSFFKHQNIIYNFGGYGLYKTNSTLLSYNKDYKTWDEVVVNNDFPYKNGLMDFESMVYDNKYFIIGGQSTFNQFEKLHNNLIYYDFSTSKWVDLGELNYTLTDRDSVVCFNGKFYIIDDEKVTIINVKSNSMVSYIRKKDSELYNKSSGSSIVFSNHKYVDNRKKPHLHSTDEDELFCDDNLINYFVENSSKFESSILKNFPISELINKENSQIDSLYKDKLIRYEFTIPLIIILIILLLNVFYKSFKKVEIQSKIFTYKSGILIFNNKEIPIDEYTKLILDLLTKNQMVSNNDVIEILAKNGMSMDYASKIKNKTFERLNEKFEFVTGLDERFIQVHKSKEDKRIQIIKLIDL